MWCFKRSERYMGSGHISGNAIPLWYASTEVKDISAVDTFQEMQNPFWGTSSEVKDISAVDKFQEMQNP